MGIAEMGWSTVAGDSGSPAGVPTPCWGPGLPSSSLHQPLHLMEMLSLNHHTGSQQPSPYLLQTKEHILGGICSIRALGSLVFHLSMPGLAAAGGFSCSPHCPGSPLEKAIWREKELGVTFFFSPSRKRGKFMLYLWVFFLLYYFSGMKWGVFLIY